MMLDEKIDRYDSGVVRDNPLWYFVTCSTMSDAQCCLFLAQQQCSLFNEFKYMAVLCQKKKPTNPISLVDCKQCIQKKMMREE